MCPLFKTVFLGYRMFLVEFKRAYRVSREILFKVNIPSPPQRKLKQKNIIDLWSRFSSLWGRHGTVRSRARVLKLAEARKTKTKSSQRKTIFSVKGNVACNVAIFILSSASPLWWLEPCRADSGLGSPGQFLLSNVLFSTVLFFPLLVFFFFVCFVPLFIATFVLIFWLLLFPNQTLRVLNSSCLLISRLRVFIEMKL